MQGITWAGSATNRRARRRAPSSLTCTRSHLSAAETDRVCDGADLLCKGIKVLARGSAAMGRGSLVWPCFEGCGKVSAERRAKLQQKHTRTSVGTGYSARKMRVA